jgi:hypothetical protein
MRIVSQKRHPLSRDAAEALAIDGLGFLAAQEHLLLRFLQETGMSPAELRRQAGSAEVLAGILDFIAADESLLLVFAGENDIDPAQVLAARRGLLPDAAEE